MFKGTKVTDEPTVRPGGCPENYKMFENKCFRFFDEAITWSEAQAKCQEFGDNYNLATINTVREQCKLSISLLEKKQKNKNNKNIHKVTTMLATSKNVPFPGDNHLLTNGRPTDDPTL